MVVQNVMPRIEQFFHLFYFSYFSLHPMCVDVERNMWTSLARIIQFFLESPDKRASLTKKNSLKSRPFLIHNGKQTCEWRWQNDSAQVIGEEEENNMRYNRISVSQSLDESSFQRCRYVHNQDSLAM